MSKQLKELKLFLQGTVSSPSSSDIPEEANIYSKNLEPINEDGKLKGAKEDNTFRGNVDLSAMIHSVALGASESGLAFADTGGTTVYIFKDGDQITATINGTDAATVTIDYDGGGGTASEKMSFSNQAWIDVAANIESLDAVDSCDVSIHQDNSANEYTAYDRLTIDFVNTVDSYDISFKLVSGGT